MAGRARIRASVCTGSPSRRVSRLGITLCAGRRPGRRDGRPVAAARPGCLDGAAAIRPRRLRAQRDIRSLGVGATLRRATAARRPRSQDRSGPRGRIVDAGVAVSVAGLHPARARDAAHHPRNRAIIRIVPMKLVVLLLAALGVATGAAAQTLPDLPSGPVTFGDGRIVIGGDVAASIAPPDNGFFNYGTYETSTVRQLRLGVSGLVRLTERISFLGELRSENLGAIAPFAL